MWILLLWACEPDAKDAVDETALPAGDDTDVDSDCAPQTFWQDADGDGHGNNNVSEEECEASEGYVSTDDDCDDTRDDVSPAAAETCDDVDNDCDGQVDEGVLSTFFIDDDGDGFGDADQPIQACSAPDGAVADGTDCDDASATTFPGNAEVCDGEDNDCDGTADNDTALGEAEQCAASDCSVGDGAQWLDVAGTPRQLWCQDGYALVANFVWPGDTGGVAGWNSGSAVGTDFSDATASFKLSDSDINALVTTHYRGHGTATQCVDGPCSIDTTLYWSASCTYDSANPSSGDCAVAYTDDALTSPTGAVTPCSWHYGLTSVVCHEQGALGTSHSGDQVFAGEIGAYTHAYSGRSGENPSVQVWVY